MSQPSENPSAAREVTQWQRAQLIERLEDEGAADLAKSLRSCGADLRLTCTGCGAVTTVQTQCKRRWCPVCQRAISAARMQRFRSASDRMRWPLSIMLSHANEDNAANVFTTLMPAFKRFRRTTLWKNNVQGGVVSYEVTNRFGTWHDHLHALVDCRWLALETPEPRKHDSRAEQRRKLKAAKHELTTAWAACLGQETAVTWVDRANDGRLIEHIKYTVKGSDLLKCTGAIAPLLRAMKGRRLVQPFGNCYDLGTAWKTEDNANHKPCQCEHCKSGAAMVPSDYIDGAIAQVRRGKSSRLFY